jgi:hypothetical protein
MGDEGAGDARSVGVAVPAAEQAAANGTTARQAFSPRRWCAASTWLSAVFTTRLPQRGGWRHQPADHKRGRLGIPHRDENASSVPINFSVELGAMLELHD